MKMSSQPSALRSSTLGPQGQYVSTPTASETSSKRPPPRLWNSALPKMKRLFPVGKKSASARAESALRPSAAQSPGGMLTHMSECMSVTRRSNRPSPSKSNAFTRSEEHTSELQSRLHLVCRLLLEKKKNRLAHS